MPEYPWIIYRMSEGPLTVKEVHQGVNEQLNRKLGTDWGYSEYEWANLLQGFRPLPIRTASGTIAHFEDGADDVPMKSVVANIVPIQDLHGYANPWIGGSGSNKWDEQWELGGFNSVGEPIPADDRIRSVNFTPIQPNTSYYFKTTNTIGVRYYDANKGFISSANGTNTALTTPSNAYYLKLLILNTTTYGNNVAVNYPSSVTTYSPYENVCPISGTSVLDIYHSGADTSDYDTTSVALGQEIMGGSADVVGGSGTSDLKYLEIDGTEASLALDSAPNVVRLTLSDLPSSNVSSQDYRYWGSESIYKYSATSNLSDNEVTMRTSGYLYYKNTNCTTLSDFQTFFATQKANGTPFAVCYELATPTDFTFTGQPINSYLGTNNVWTDSGEVLDVEYRSNF